MRSHRHADVVTRMSAMSQPATGWAWAAAAGLACPPLAAHPSQQHQQRGLPMGAEWAPRSAAQADATTTSTRTTSCWPCSATAPGCAHHSCTVCSSTASAMASRAARSAALRGLRLQAVPAQLGSMMIVMRL